MTTPAALDVIHNIVCIGLLCLTFLLFVFMVRKRKYFEAQILGFRIRVSESPPVDGLPEVKPTKIQL